MVGWNALSHITSIKWLPTKLPRLWVRKRRWWPTLTRRQRSSFWGSTNQPPRFSVETKSLRNWKPNLQWANFWSMTISIHSRNASNRSNRLCHRCKKPNNSLLNYIKRSGISPRPFLPKKKKKPSRAIQWPIRMLRYFKKYHLHDCFDECYVYFLSIFSFFSSLCIAREFSAKFYRICRIKSNDCRYWGKSVFFGDEKPLLSYFLDFYCDK